jgi:hypothetical protein
MQCRDTYHCLCAYLLDEGPDSETVKLIREDPDLCPKCRTCNDRDRRRQLQLQRSVTALVQKQRFNVTAPDFLKQRIITELGDPEEYRESGVSALDLIRWGTHIAQIYNTKGDLSEVIVPYIGKGLEENELCVWVIRDMSEEEARTALMEEIPCLQEYIDIGQLQLISYKDWALSEACFDSQRTLDNCLKKCQEALASGYLGLRIVGNASRLEQSDWDSVMEYEGLLNNALPNYKALAMCSYKESECTIDNIVDVTNTHQYVISKIDDCWRLRRSAEIE